MNEVANKCKKCDRTDVDSTGMCILHSLDPKKDLNSFRKEFGQLFKIEDRKIRSRSTTFNRLIDCSWFVFPAGFELSHMEFVDPADFSNSTFLATADFCGTVFRSFVIFRNSKFPQGAIFTQHVGPSMMLPVDLSAHGFVQIALADNPEQVRGPFLDSVHFTGSFFGKETSFFAQFTGECKFVGCTFEKVTFSHSRFKEDSDFSRCQFNGLADFSYTSFDKEVRFTSCSLSNGLFANSRFPQDDLAYFDDLELTTKGRLRFIGRGRESLSLGRVSFLHTDVRRVVFLNVEWGRRRNRVVSIDEKLAESHGDYNAVAETYRGLRKNYEKSARYAEAGDFYVSEMEMRLRHSWQNHKAEAILLFFYRNICLYGESYGRPFVLLGFVILLSAISRSHQVLRVLMDPSAFCPNMIVDLVLSFLVSVVESLAVSFQIAGTSPPDILQRILSAFMLGFTYLAMRRKFERR